MTRHPRTPIDRTRPPTALPHHLLTGKRSQVQTLSRPPPFSQVNALLASSWERSLPGWAARPSRRQAHWPFRAVHSGRQAPQQPRTGVAHPAQDGSHPASSGKDRNGALPSAVPGSAASEACPSRRSGLPSRSAVERGRRSPAEHNGPVRDPPACPRLLAIPDRDLFLSRHAPPQHLGRRVWSVTAGGAGRRPRGGGGAPPHRSRTRCSRCRPGLAPRRRPGPAVGRGAGSAAACWGTGGARSGS
jgi:hypothetical protein